ncbi:glutathione S-transferase family protein [Leptothoe spongobia]|nr:glutathione S-transferase family protein [Leptothoe spongobia]
MVYKLYGYPQSGNCYKVQLLLHQLAIPFEWVSVDLLTGEQHTPEYLAKNPAGKLPLLEIQPGQTLPESNAILYYLSQGTNFLPTDLYQQAQVLQWMFFEQYSHTPNVAIARYIVRFLGNPPDHQASLAMKQTAGYAALDVMEQHLQTRTFFVGEHYTIADISLYAYTHVADEGDFDLSNYPAINGWLNRVKSQPNYVAISH